MFTSINATRRVAIDLHHCRHTIMWDRFYLCLFCYSVAQSCLTLCHPMDCRMPGLPVLHYLLEFVQTHVHWVGDAIQPFHPLLYPSPPAVDFSQHQGLFKWVDSFHQAAKVLAFYLQHHSFPINIQGWFPLGLTGWVSLQSKGLSRVFSSTLIQKHQFLGPQPSFGPILISVHDYWKNPSFDYMNLCQQSDISAF